MAEKSNAIRAGRAYVELFGDDSALVRTLDRSKARVQKWGAAVTTVGQGFASASARIFAAAASGLVPLTLATRRFTSAGDAIAKFSTRTGVAEEEASSLAYAVEQSGSDLETLQKGLRAMQLNIAGADDESSSFRGTLKELGVDLSRLRRLSPDGQFRALAEAISRVVDPAKRAAIAAQVFSRAGIALFPMMSGGAKGLATLEERARKLGLTMSAVDARAAEELGDLFSDLLLTIKAIGFAVGAQLAPTLKRLVEYLIDATVAVGNWVRENRAAVFFMVLGISAAGSLAIALTGLAAAVKLVSFALGMVSGGLGLAMAGLKLLAPIFASLLSPMGLMVAAALAATVAVLYFTGAAGKATRWLGERFNELWSDAQAAWKGIGDALSDGNIGLAMEVLWLTLKLEWTKGVTALHAKWLDFKFAVLQIAEDMFYGLQAAVAIAVDAILVAWIEMKAKALSIWQSVSSGFMDAWDGAIGWVEKRIHDLWGLMDQQHYDAEAAKKAVDDRIGTDVNRRADERQRDLDKIEADRKKAREAEQAAHEKRLGGIGQKSIDQEDLIKRTKQRELAADQSALEKVKQAWRDALMTAEMVRRIAEGRNPPGVQPPPVPDVPASLEQINRTIGVRGTFSAAEASRFGAGGATDKLVDAAKETAKNTKRMAQKLDEAGPLVWE